MQEEYKNEIEISDNEQPVPSVEEIKIPVPWGEICGKWWGSKNQQPVLAIHGWQDNAGSFDTLAPLLANDFSILCIDLPGHGFSSAYPKGQYYYLIWDGVILVRRIVQYFKWKKVKLMGHSVGGSIAFVHAALYPEETDFYIGLDIATPCVFDTVNLNFLIRDHIDRFLKYENLSSKDMLCGSKQEMSNIGYQGHKGSLTRKSNEIMMLRGLQQLNDNNYFFTSDIRIKECAITFFFDMDQAMELASRITCSVLNIRGNPGCRDIYPYGFANNYDKILEKIEETAKYVDKHVVPGTHHFHLNNAESIADIIRTFLFRQ